MVDILPMLLVLPLPFLPLLYLMWRTRERVEDDDDDDWTILWPTEKGTVALSMDDMVKWRQWEVSEARRRREEWEIGKNPEYTGGE